MMSLHKSLKNFNLAIIFNMIGYMIMCLGALMLAPLICAVCYQEWDCLNVFVITGVLCLAIGFLLSKLPAKREHYFSRDGLFAAGLGWIFISLFGGLPFYISRAIPSFVDCFFETVSGFTTCGATILTDVESLPRSILFWRSFTHWIGGMGILVFILAFLPRNNERSMYIMKAEMPGPTISKLVPKLKDTAKILYILYFALSILEAVFLLMGRMPIFDTLVNTFGTAGTGGFGILAKSIGQYNNPYYEAVIGIFMFLFGINFNLFFFLTIKDFKTVFKNEELKAYFWIVAVSTAVIMLNIRSMYDSWMEAFRYASFQVVSIITTTGYATTDFNLWPMFSKGVLLILMITGAMAGSTCGGVKISRCMIIVKQIKLNIQKLEHPRKVDAISCDGKIIDPEIVSQTMSFFSTWMVLIGIGILLVGLDNFDFETTVSSVITCIGDVGPGLGLCGPMGGFSQFSVFSKIVLSMLMLIGRLEIYPILLFVSPLLTLFSHKTKRNYSSQTRLQ